MITEPAETDGKSAWLRGEERGEGSHEGGPYRWSKKGRGGPKMTPGPGGGDGWKGVSECVVGGLTGAGQAHQWGWRQEGVDS